MIQQTPWLQRHFHFDFPVTLFPVIFSRLEGSLFRLAHLLQTADEEHCSYNPHGWSVKQHLGHLYDLEELWWQRLADFQEYKAVLTAADVRNQKTEEAQHNENTLENLLHSFVLERQKMLETVYGLDAVDLGKTAMHPRLNQPMRLLDLLYFIAEHDDHHIAAISTLLRKPAG